MPSRTILPMLVVLAACAKPDPHPTQVDAAKLSAKGSSGTGPVARPKSPSPLAYPTVFQGRWGVTPADCDISRIDTRNFMKISGDKIDFYASTGHVARIENMGPMAVTALVDMNEPGRKWQDRMTLIVREAGTRLLRTMGSGAAIYRYTRC